MLNFVLNFLATSIVPELPLFLVRYTCGTYRAIKKLKRCIEKAYLWTVWLLH